MTTHRTDTARASVVMLTRILFVAMVLAVVMGVAWVMRGESANESDASGEVRWTQIGTPPVVYDWTTAPLLLDVGRPAAAGSGRRTSGRRIEVLDWGLVEGRGIAALPSTTAAGCTDLIVADAWEALYHHSIATAKDKSDSSCHTASTPRRFPEIEICPSGICAEVDHRGIAFIGYADRDKKVARVLVADAHQSRLSVKTAGHLVDPAPALASNVFPGITAVSAASPVEWFATMVPEPVPASERDKQAAQPGQLLALKPSGERTTLEGDLRRPVGVAYSPFGPRLYVADAREDRTIWFFYVRDAACEWHPGGVLASEAPDRGATLPVLQGMAIASSSGGSRGGEIFAAGPGGLYVFHPDGTLIARYVLSERIAGLAWGGDNMLYMTIGHRLARLKTKVPGATLSNEPCAPQPSAAPPVTAGRVKSE